MARQRIFIVEDDRATRELLMAALGDAYDILFARDGRQALRSVRAAAPDLLLLDLGLPEMSGDAFVREWRERDAAALTIPIIVISALAGGDAIAKAIGAAAYHPKPFKLARLTAEVHRLLPAPPERGNEGTAVRIGDMQTASGHTVRVSVQADAEAPFIVEILSTDLTLRLTANELELALTLLDIAGRKAGMATADLPAPDSDRAAILGTAFPTGDAPRAATE